MSQRVAALWFPDWPVQAVRAEMGLPAGAEIAVVDKHRVLVGKGRGRAIRQVQAEYPDTQIIAHSPERDGRVFAEIAAGLDDVASSIEVLRPGLVVVNLQAVAHFHGSEAVGVEKLLDASARPGIDVQVGVADEIPTAVLAARAQTLVPEGRSREFLASLPLRVLEALDVERTLLRSLSTLGINTLGEFAQLPTAAVATRFGSEGVRAHHLARAEQSRRVAPAMEETCIKARADLEEPIQRVDEAAFAARALAADLHRQLAEAGLACVRLRVHAELADGVLERMWHTREGLSESGTADRIRWQLDAWLTAGGRGEILGLELSAVEVIRPKADTFMRRPNSDPDAARRAVERVQSTLGVDKVLQPRRVGGRGVAESIDYVPFGEDYAHAEGSWPGRIPHPLPARLGPGPTHPASRVRLIDAAARDVYVTAEALLSSQPYALHWGKRHYLIAAWAGPWPVEAGWWRDERQVARIQVVGMEPGSDCQQGWLLLWAGSWRVEALYS